MMETDDKVAIVVDNGSYSIKAGFAEDDAPKAMFPSVIGRYKDGQNINNSTREDYFVGDKAQEKRGILALNYPVQNGVVTDWDEMESIWRYMFDTELKIDKKERNVLMTEAPFNPNSNREKMTEVMFESFHTPGFHVAIPAHLAVYANGRVSSLVFDCGEGVSHVVIVYEGFTAPFVTQRTNIAGSDVTSHLARLLSERGQKFTTASEMEIVREMKEKLCYVSEDYEKELSESQTKTTFTLPDGKEIKVGNELFRATECIFDPGTIGIDGLGAHELINKCLKLCDIDMRSDIFCNLMMSGGATMLRGFKERMQHEMKKLLPQTRRIQVMCPPERKYSPWIGGSILTSLSTFQHGWITKQMYEEDGSAIVHKKCFRFQQASPDY